jgi:hypothetical protein
LDTRFFLYFEDVDWCYRMWARGFEVHYYPTAAFVHQYRRSSRRLSKSLFYHLHSFVSFYDKWGALLYVAKWMRRGWERLMAFLLDALLLNLAFIGAYLVRRLIDPFFPLPLHGFENYLPLMAFINVVAAFTLPSLGRYREPVTRSASTHWLDAARMALLVGLVVMAGTFLSHTRTYSRAVILLLMPLYVFSLGISQLLMQRFFGRQRETEREITRALLLGSPKGVEALARRLKESVPGELTLAGFVSPEGAPAIAGLRPLGEVARLEEILDSYRVGEVLVAAENESVPEAVAGVRKAVAAGVPVYLSHPWADAIAGAEGTVRRHGLRWWSVQLPPARVEGTWFKRLQGWMGVGKSTPSADSGERD